MDISATLKDQIVFTDWEKLDIRLGTIMEATEPEWSNKLIELHVDFGESVGQRTIFTGLKKWYSAEHFVGKQGLFLINLPPRKMGEGESQGMFLSLSSPNSDSNSTPTVLLFDDIGANGSVVC